MPGWTYSNDPTTSALDEVRFLATDTDQSKPWTLYDAEINYLIGLWSGSPPQPGHNYLAAARAAETIVGKFKGFPTSKKVGDLSVDFGKMFQYFSDLVRTLRNLAALDTVPPYVGGTSYATKSAYNQDPDRVQPEVQVDGMNWASPLNQNPPNTGP